MHDPVVFSSYARTPIGNFQGILSPLKAPELGAFAIRAAIKRAQLAGSEVNSVFMGCVLPAALGQAPARQAALMAGLPKSVAATTINKMCGSGMQAAIMAWNALAAGSEDVIVAGGMESMTNAPYALAKHRSGARIGHDIIVDTLMMDGLEDAYTPGKPMGAFAEEAAQHFKFTRNEQDEYALRSLARAKRAIAKCGFGAEITPVAIGDHIVDTDEHPRKLQPSKIPALRPAFADNGTITAANASSISDGAAALVMTRKSVAERLGIPIVATVVSHATHAQAPELFTTAPVPAIRSALSKAGWTMDEVDLFEINEAFAVVAMITARDLAIPADKLNVNGGSTALGHPIGASGARILVTLLAALQQRGLKRGIASICIGGGEATAMTVEIT